MALVPFGYGYGYPGYYGGYGSGYGYGYPAYGGYGYAGDFDFFSPFSFPRPPLSLSSFPSHLDLEMKRKIWLFDFYTYHLSVRSAAFALLLCSLMVVLFLLVGFPAYMSRRDLRRAAKVIDFCSFLFCCCCLVPLCDVCLFFSWAAPFEMDERNVKKRIDQSINQNRVKGDMYSETI